MAAGPDARHDFTPMMVLYLNDQIVVDDLLAGAADGVVFGAKYYPAGATTNSAAGGNDLLASPCARSDGRGGDPAACACRID